MKSLGFCLLGVVCLNPGLPAQDPKEPAGGKELRDRCHAHLAYTSALAERDNKIRMELLNKALALDPTLARAFYNRGVLHALKDDLPRARADFEKAVQLNPDHIYAHYNLACVGSLASRADDALKSLETALAKGYRKFDKIPGDPDFTNLKGNPAFLPLIAKYKALAAKQQPSPLQKLQTADTAGRAGILAVALRDTDKQAAALAAWAMHDPDPEIRALAMQLWRKAEVAESRPALVQGLYDVNGDVCKAAANALVRYGKDADGLVAWALQDRGTPAPFYAMQVLAAVDAQGAPAKIVPLLRDRDPMMRVMAAETLAGLGAVSALPQVEAALRDLPEDKRKQGFYKAAVRRAVALLKKAKEGGGK